MYVTSSFCAPNKYAGKKKSEPEKIHWCDNPSANNEFVELPYSKIRPLIKQQDAAVDILVKYHMQKYEDLYEYFQEDDHKAQQYAERLWTVEWITALRSKLGNLLASMTIPLTNTTTKCLNHL